MRECKKRKEERQKYTWIKSMREKIHEKYIHKERGTMTEKSVRDRKGERNINKMKQKEMPK